MNSENMNSENINNENINNEKQEKQIKFFLLLLLIALVIGGATLFFVHTKNDSFFEYSGFTVHEVVEKGAKQYDIQFFKAENNQPFIISSRFNPEELESIPAYEGLRDDLIKEALFKIIR